MKLSRLKTGVRNVAGLSEDGVAVQDQICELIDQLPDYMSTASNAEPERLDEPSCSEAFRVTTWGWRSGAGAEQLVLIGRCRLLFVVSGRHGDQVIGRRRPSRCLFGRSCGRAVCSRLEAQWSP